MSVSSWRQEWVSATPMVVGKGLPLPLGTSLCWGWHSESLGQKVHAAGSKYLLRV